MSDKRRQKCLSGLIYFRIYMKRDGSTKELHELEDDSEEVENLLEELSGEISETFETYVRTNFTIVKVVTQVELYDANPVIDYSITHTDPSLTESALAGFNFEICKKYGDYALYATTTRSTATVW